MDATGQHRRQGGQQRSGGHGHASNTEAEQHTEICLPVLREQRPGNKGGQPDLRGLHGENGGGGLMAAKNKAYQMSFRCYFGGSADNLTKHRQELPLKDIPKWIEAYQFTHPTCRSISVKVWFDAAPEAEN